MDQSSASVRDLVRRFEELNLLHRNVVMTPSLDKRGPELEAPPPPLGGDHCLYPLWTKPLHFRQMAASTLSLPPQFLLYRQRRCFSSLSIFDLSH